jgi:hypothetical protein
LDVLIVSAALDTNGQNARFARAAQRWGSDPDILKALVVGEYDPANVGNRYAAASADAEGLSIRAAHVSEAYFEFPVDIRWSRANHPEVQKLADECDVVHLNNSPYPYKKLKLARQRKPALLHHHGSLLRNRGVEMVADARRYAMVEAVSTIDLLRWAPDATWQPTAYDLDELAAVREQHRRPDDGLVRIVSCPTNAEYKSTALLEAAVKQLQADGLPVELVLVSGKRWAEALAIKATADIYFDQVAVPAIDYPGGYGCNAVEAWAMGISVVAGADEWTTARMRSEWNLRGNTPLPFYPATQDTIIDALRALVTKGADYREEWADTGYRHVATHHAEKPALARLAELYGKALAKQQAAVEAGATYDEFAPGTFRTELPKCVVTIGNQRYAFVDQHITITDPRKAQKMRGISKARKQLRISEVEYQQAEGAA